MRHIMRIGLSALVIACLNLVAVVCGTLIYRLSREWPYVLLEGAASVALGVTLAAAWVVRSHRRTQLNLDGDYIYEFLVAFPVGAILYVCSSYAAFGYVAGGVGGIMIFGVAQFVLNSMSGAVSTVIMRRVQARAPATA